MTDDSTTTGNLSNEMRRQVPSLPDHVGRIDEAWHQPYLTDVPTGKALVGSDIYEQQRSHVSWFFPKVELQEITWPHGPITQHLPRWRVLGGQLDSFGGAWIYFIHGAWEVVDSNHAFEFFVLTDQRRDDSMSELLAMITYFYGDPRSDLDVGKVIDVGRPWAPGSDLNHVLISVPYPFGPDLEHCVVDKRHIRYLWALPITQSEAQFARTEGSEALESLFERQQIDAVDPKRRAVA